MEPSPAVATVVDPRAEAIRANSSAAEAIEEGSVAEEIEEHSVADAEEVVEGAELRRSTREWCRRRVCRDAL